jgi:enterochelin esterase-like enzyme
LLKITKGKETNMTTTNNNQNKTSQEPAIASVDKNGLDQNGRMIAAFGTPVIDGKVDEIWSKVQPVKPQYISGNTDTTVTFKALWDDNALYILAEVKDNELTARSDNPPNQDSLEIFLDENNDKVQDYGVDDLHLRVNYENKQSVDIGNAERFYTSTSKTEDGYIIEARIAFQSKPSNGKVLGFELQINDAKGNNRVGSLNVFDSTGTAWINVSKFGEIVLTGKTEGAVSGLNPYDLLSLINNTHKIKSVRYKNLGVVTDAVKAAQAVLADNSVTQKQIDEQYANVKEAISKLVLTDEAANEKEFRAVPGEYRAESNKPGSIERLEYNAANLNGGTDVKKLNVYLPYEYDASDKSKKYNVLYLMHGGGENENLLFGGPGENKELKKIIDNLIEKGDIDPLIVVTPTFYGGKNDVKYFPEELLNSVIPLVETKYNTYLASTNVQDIKATREHRAFGGFSMGSVTTWYTFINCLDYVKYYLPLSGDCWIKGMKGGGDYPKETAEYLAKVAKESGYKPHDYYLFCATGDLDIAYPNLNPQVEEMKKLKDTFIYSSDLKKGNFYFIVCDGGTHAWNWVNQYIYDILPDLFK